MDIANLAGIHKYNSLSIFQRVYFFMNLDPSKNRIIVKKAWYLSSNYGTATS